jgi:hypothetical protein
LRCFKKRRPRIKISRRQRAIHGTHLINERLRRVPKLCCTRPICLGQNGSPISTFVANPRRQLVGPLSGVFPLFVTPSVVRRRNPGKLFREAYHAAGTKSAHKPEGPRGHAGSKQLRHHLRCVGMPSAARQGGRVASSTTRMRPAARTGRNATEARFEQSISAPLVRLRNKRYMISAA